MLVPDFQGDKDALHAVLDAEPHVLAHNLETVERLTPEIRGRGEYRRSLGLLAESKRRRPGVLSKSGIMLGLGEDEAEVDQALQDLRAHQVDLVTLGQYLAPSTWHRPVQAWIPPERFARWAGRCAELGFRHAACGPLVRSSYRAEESLGLPLTAAT